MSDREYIWMDPDLVVTDTGMFFERLAQARSEIAGARARSLEEAVGLVSGPMLSGWNEPWINAQWMRIEEAYSQVVVELMQLLADENELGRAIQIGKNALAIVGIREDVHIELIRQYSRAGLAAQAIAQFETLERLLDDQWGEQPSQEARRALEAVPSGPSVSLPKRTPSLPSKRLSVIGRDEETQKLSTLLIDPAGPRLVTILGVGGIGKTTVALQISRTMVEEHGTALSFVPLAEVESPRGLMEATVSAMQIAGGNDPLGAIQRATEHAPYLLVLDNFEQLVNECGAVVSSLLDRCPNVRILVTSRHKIQVLGEHIYRLAPLKVPAQRPSLAELVQSPSVRLYSERARAVNPDFEVTPTNAGAVLALCQMLDGLPLAIELAAARADVHSPAQTLARMCEGDTFLLSDESDRSDRHKSLRSALEWSLRWLDKPVQDAFGQLSAFRGSFTADAAEFVTLGSVRTAELSSLVGHSLIETVAGSDPIRFRLLEPVRQHAAARAARDSGNFSARSRHYEYFEKRSATLSKDVMEHSELALDAANIWTALEFGCQDPDYFERTANFVIGLRDFARLSGLAPIWREVLQSVRSVVQDHVLERTRGRMTLWLAASSRNALSVNEVRALYEGAQKDLKSSNDLESLPFCQEGLAAVYKASGDYAAADPLYQAAAEAFDKLGDKASIGRCYRDWAMNANSVNDFEEGRRRLLKALEATRQADDPEQLAWVLTDLGTELAILSDVTESEEHFAEAFRICETIDSKRMTSIVHWQHGESELRTARYEESVRSHQTALKLGLEGGYPEGAKWYLLTLGCALEKCGRHVEAARCWGKVKAMRDAEGRKNSGDENEILEPSIDRCIQALGKQNFERSWDEGAQTELAELVDSLLLTAASS